MPERKSSQEMGAQMTRDEVLFYGFSNYFAEKCLQKKFIELEEKRKSQERTNN